MSASVARTVTVTILDDRQAVLDFMAWRMAEDVYPIRGTVTSNGATGSWFGTFDGDDERALMHYFARSITATAERHPGPAVNGSQTGENHA